MLHNSCMQQTTAAQMYKYYFSKHTKHTSKYTLPDIVYVFLWGKVKAQTKQKRLQCRLISNSLNNYLEKTTKI